MVIQGQSSTPFGYNRFLSLNQTHESKNVSMTAVATFGETHIEPRLRVYFTIGPVQHRLETSLLIVLKVADVGNLYFRFDISML